MRRIAILGKNNIAVKTTEILKARSECEIVLVSPNNSDDGIDDWQLSLRKFAISNQLPIHSFKKIKNKESIDFLHSLKLDYIFSFQYDQIISQEVIDTAKFGALNLHFAPLPKYRGISPIAFALINGENSFGITLHYMDPGIDTGDIISQKSFKIANIKNARELYDLSVKKGIELFEDSIEDILNLQNFRVPQDNSKALYYSRGSIDFSNNYVNWNKDTYSLFNWVRAFIFPPFQHPRFIYEGKEYEVLSASPDYRKNNFEKPGTLIFKTDKSFKFATHDSYITVTTK